MKKMLAVASLLFAVSSAKAMYMDTTGCSEKNKPAVLFVLDRISQERSSHGQEVSGVQTLISVIKGNSQVQLTDEALSSAGLNNVQIQEVRRILTIQE